MSIHASATSTKSSHLRQVLYQILTQYHERLDGTPPQHLYDLVQTQIEPILLEFVLQKTNYNQSESARWLGVSRGKFRKWLKKYGFLPGQAHSSGLS